MDLSPIKQIPILEVAKRLGIVVRGKTAMCFVGHDKLTPSLSFRPERNSWKCFGACDQGGDNIALVMAVLQLDFKAAIKWFSENYFTAEVVAKKRRLRGKQSSRGSSAPHSTTIAAARPPSKDNCEIYAWLMDKCGEVSRPIGVEYLRSHGISLGTAKKYGVRELRSPARALRVLAEYWGNARISSAGITQMQSGKLIWHAYCLLFPFRERNVVTYVQARMFGGKSKYLNLRGIPKPIFNLDRLHELPEGSTVHMCEGVSDALAL